LWRRVGLGGALAWGDDWKTERLGGSGHASVVSHDSSKIASDAERGSEVDSVKRAYRGWLDLSGPLEKIVIQSNEVNAGQLPASSLHESWESGPPYGTQKLDAQKCR